MACYGDFKVWLEGGMLTYAVFLTGGAPKCECLCWSWGSCVGAGAKFIGLVGWVFRKMNRSVSAFRVTPISDMRQGLPKVP